MLGEDVFISDFFKNKNEGFYVDVGCYHPFEGNNTYLLYKKNWSGINIDVNSLSIELFDKARSRDVNVNLAVSNQETKLKLYFRKKINMLNTLNKQFAEKNFPNGFKEKTVKANTLNSILESSKYKSRKIDFLNIDVEGNEMNVLKSLNFELYSPQLICIEIHDENLKENTAHKFLTEKKYNVVWKNKYSFIFKRIYI